LKKYKKRLPSDGMMIPLFADTDKNGWHYQGDVVNDSRFKRPKFITVYSFPPNRGSGSSTATYYLRKVITK